MKNNGLYLVTLSLLGMFPTAFAGTMGPASSAPANQTGFFAGVGGSYNAVRMNADTSAVLNAVSGFPPLGTFTGTTGSHSRTQSAVAPEAQIGYFQNVRNSDWLWGLEFLYQYSNIKARRYGTQNDINLSDASTQVTDLINIRSIQTKVNTELALPVFIGHTFKNSFVYVGGGPAVLHAQRNVSSATDNLSALYFGTVNGFSNSKWIWGGAVQAGVAYYLTPTWFLKLNYTYTGTGRYTTHHSASYTAANGGLNAGTIAFNTSQRVSAQEAALSINKIFSL